LKDLFWMIFGFYFQQRGGGTAFGAHVGGFLAGLALVAIYKFFIKRREAKTEPEDLIINPAQILATAAATRETATSETPTIFLHDGNQQTGPFTLTQVHPRRVLLERRVGRLAEHRGSVESARRLITACATNLKQSAVARIVVRESARFWS
jgi:hypothetical protein